MRRSVGFNATSAEIEMIDRLVVERRRQQPEIDFTRAGYIRQATLRALAGDIPAKIRDRVRPTPSSQ